MWLTSEEFSRAKNSWAYLPESGLLVDMLSKFCFLAACEICFILTQDLSREVELYWNLTCLIIQHYKCLNSASSQIWSIMTDWRYLQDVTIWYRWLWEFHPSSYWQWFYSRRPWCCWSVPWEWYLSMGQSTKQTSMQLGLIDIFLSETHSLSNFPSIS